MNADYFINMRWLEATPEDFRESIQSAVVDQDPSALSLKKIARYALDEAQLHKLGAAFLRARRAGNPWTGLTPFRLALLSNATTDHLLPGLAATALRYGIDLSLFSLSYEEAYIAAIGGDIRLKEFAPDAVIFAMDYLALPLGESLNSSADERQIVARCNAYLQAMYEGVQRSCNCLCIAQTIAYPLASSLGHADKKIAGALRRIIAGINDFIAGSDVLLLDIAGLAETIGTASWFDAKLAYTGKIPFALPLVPLYADHICRVIGALRGKSRRVLVLDLDNTLWGGVVGDDGVEGLAIGNGNATGEAYLDFQRKIAALRKRGILLAVSSKNDEAQARRPFREIPDMLLKEDHFASFRANWDDKAANIRAIAQELSLGLDSFVFVDDNPVERALVRRFLPEVAVPEMPEDPSYYASVLTAAGYFEAVSFSEEDAKRADLYRAQATIAGLAPHDLKDYLASLDMKLTIDTAGPANRARAVQLINKSNQFNLTTRRLSDTDMRAMETDDKFVTLAIRLTDKFNDHGIISVILCEKRENILHIILWVMSCRVIGRGVEKAMTGFLIEKARQMGCIALQGEYIPTARNRMVAEHYAGLGFDPIGRSEEGTTRWHLQTQTNISAPSLQIIDNTRPLR